MTILEIGPFSYVGGVSNHIKRLIGLLKDWKDANILKIDESPLKVAKKELTNSRRLTDFLKLIMKMKKAEIVHIHSVHWLLRVYHILLAILFRKIIVITIHSFRLSKIQKKVTIYFLKRSDLIITVSEDIYEEINNEALNLVIKEAFIPPQLEKESQPSEEILLKIKALSQNKILVGANAFRLTFFQGKELYGLDQCIELASIIKSENLNFCIVFLVGTVTKHDKIFKIMANEIHKRGLSDHIILLKGGVSFVNMMEYFSIILRPTLTDGDALTIREGLYFNKNVIASDVVKRPQGTILYEAGNVLDLFKKLKNVVSKLNNNSKYNEVTMREYFNYYQNLYKKCYS